MKICTFYLQQERVIYKIVGAQSETGRININEIEAFLEKQHPDVMNVIISKPYLLFRKIEVPFRNKRKIDMVIPSEIEDTLPESIDNFYFSFDIFPLERNRTVVNVYAVPSTVVSFWNNLAKKYRVKMYFFSDTLLFYHFLKQSTDEKNYIAIYTDQEYLLLNIIEEGILTGVYSYQLIEQTRGESIALIKGILEKKDFPLFICGPQGAREELAVEEAKVHHINLPADIDIGYLFHHLAYPRRYRRIFLPLKYSVRKRIPASDIGLFVSFLIISFFFVSPYFKIAEKQKEMNKIEQEMRRIFSSTFPDVHNIVNPLVQAREKILQGGDIEVKGISSVLKIMAEITLLFPENTDAGIDIFRVAGDTITLSGNANSLKTLERIKGRIENSEKFTIIDIGTISFDEKNRVSFTMTLKVN